ncbi:Aspyridones efflux protein apdF [Lasiodiplodia hormozganensis]|uniref:Aspyridones efflux protein apdF n=1 Tax=Lasiodiplodia hormozganensis TaxID=869390 RepID=A0AA40CL62_9PEZI|nr:Aspyridones efflux protein apdF [Lasiodiplodia hormozganensis]
MRDRADLVEQVDLEHLSQDDSSIVSDGEGGLQAWLTITGSFLVYFASFGYMNSFGFFQDYYQQHYLSDYAPSLIALIGTLQLGLMYLVGPVAGVLFDAYGFQGLYAVAAVGSIVSCIGLSFAQSGHIWQQFLFQGVVFGLTISFGTQSTLAIAGQHFKKKRSLAMGIVAGGSSAGGVCLPIMFSRLVPQIGFGWSIRVAALIFLCCYSTAMVISKQKLPRKPLKSAREILDFDGYRDLRYCAIAAANFVGNLGLYIPYYYVEPYFSIAYPNASIRSYLLPLINASSFFGRLCGGYAADHIGRLNLLYPMTTLSGIISLAMWLPATNPATVIAFTCLYGFCSGIFISVTPSAVAQISPEEKLGARLGALNISAMTVLVGTPIGGAFIKNGTVEEYNRLIVYGGVTTTVAGLLMFVARILCDRDLRKKW